ncbi:MAG: diguanylate cyclase [Anaerolineales bacterium]|nr:diguanylate cyclase [Anaerolineales bacterium]
MEIRFYLRTIQRSWWMIVVSILVAVNLSLVYSYFITTPLYESTARFIISPNLEYVEGRDLVNSLEALDKRSIITTYAEVITSPQIFNSTITLLNGNPSDFIDYTTSFAVLPDTNIISFTVRGPDPQVTAMLANSIGQHGIDFIQQLYIAYDIDFLDKAMVPLEPYYPRPVQDATLAFLIGTVVGVGLAIFRDMLSSTLERLSERKMFDYESQAFSRSYFERRVRDEMTTSPGNVLTLGFIYLNGVEEFYDSLPQTYVNMIMQKVTETLKYQLRGNDIVGRWSKLQFSILLPSTDGEAARQRMTRIQAVLNEEFSLEPGDKLHLVLDPRIGLADRQGGEPFQVIVNQAQAALEISMQSDEKINLYKVRPFG